MSNRLFQGIIHQMKDAIDRTVGVIDENYTVIASMGHMRDLPKSQLGIDLENNDLSTNIKINFEQKE